MLIATTEGLGTALASATAGEAAGDGELVVAGLATAAEADGLAAETTGLAAVCGAVVG
jgi:hypothetical protein